MMNGLEKEGEIQTGTAAICEEGNQIYCSAELSKCQTLHHATQLTSWYSVIRYWFLRTNYHEKSASRLQFTRNK